MNPLEAQQLEQARKQINQIAEEIAQLSEQDLQPAQYYSEFLQRVYFAMQGFAAAVWIRTPQGNLVLQCQINLRELGLDRTQDSRPMHDELLRQAALQGKGGIVRPQFSHNFGTGPEQIAGNPTDFVILLVPILMEKQVIGLVELWIDPNRQANVVQSLYQFLVRMAAFVSLFQRNHQLRTMLGQQETWLKLENFSRQIHNSLNTTEVSYLIANEARRLIEVDRVSVAIRPAAKCEISAISGADVVEKRSNLVTLLRALVDAVIAWGEKLIYTGTKDDALPPKVLHALDAYLGESNAKVVVVMPLHDERDKESKKPARSALVMECFETNLQPEQLIARLEVVGRHAGPALYNALEYRRIPMRFLWLPLAYLQDGLGGKTKAIITAVTAGIAALIIAMIFVPFPLRMEANGPMLPRDRQFLYAPIPGKVEDILAGLKSGSKVAKGQTLMTLFDGDLHKQITELQTEIAWLEGRISPQPNKAGDAGDAKNSDAATAREAKITLTSKIKMLNSLRDRYNADLARPGYFKLVAPRAGIILSADFRENLLGKVVKPGEPLIRIGYTDPEHPRVADWELMVKIPQKHVGQVLRAYKDLPPGTELDMDVMVMTKPDEGRFRAKLRKDKIAQQAEPQKDDAQDAEPMVIAWARIHGDDIPQNMQITPAVLLSGTEVRTRIRCGDHAMGYSLFYGVFEFVYEKVIFPFMP
ncbi:MAG TPA: hypothetical protein VFE62_03295 [Gemmataceae bacterium]|nr:hypothetical protein [Gemmataceae bacterium]